MNLWFWLKIVILVGPLILGTYFSTLKISKRKKIAIWIICILICICGVILLAKEKIEKDQDYKSASYYHLLLERQELRGRGQPESYIDGLGKNPLLKHFFNAGQNYEGKDQYKEAIEEYKKCLSHPAATEENKVAASICMGNCFLASGEYGAAEKNYRNALSISKNVNDKKEKLKSQSTVLGNIGCIYLEQGRFDKALKYCEKALRLNKEIGYSEGIIDQLGEMGNIYLLLSKNDEALKYYNMALEISRETGDEYRIAKTLHNIGFLYMKSEKYEEGLKNFKEAAKIYIKLRYVNEFADQLSKIGFIYRSLGKHADALGYYKASLEIYRKIGNNWGIAKQLHGIAYIYFERGKNDAALSYYKQALKINKKIGNEGGVADQLSSIGLIYYEQGRLDEALKYYNEALIIHRTTEFKKGIADDLLGISLILIGSGKFREALPVIEESIKLHKQIGTDPEVVQVGLFLIKNIKRLSKLEDGLDWTKIVFITLVIQVVFVPILWRHFIPLKKLALNILRRASFILLAPVYLFLVVLLQLTPAEGTMVAALSGLGVGIQGVFLAMLYKRKKTKKMHL